MQKRLEASYMHMLLQKRTAKKNIVNTIKSIQIWYLKILGWKFHLVARAGMSAQECESNNLASLTPSECKKFKWIRL